LASSEESPGAQSPGKPPEDGAVADAGGRALACTLAAALAFAAAVMIMTAIDLGGTPLESEVSRADAIAGTEVYDGSSTAKTLSTIAFWASGVTAAVAVLAALVVAGTRRWNGALMPLAGLSVVLGAIGVLINNL
jgi:Mn2+/Fe2+ NRAMP family transporter